jgi:hypothetical protein
MSFVVFFSGSLTVDITPSHHVFAFRLAKDLIFHAVARGLAPGTRFGP